MKIRPRSHTVKASGLVIGNKVFQLSDDDYAADQLADAISLLEIPDGVHYLAHNVRLCRLSFGDSQIELAASAGVTQQVVSLIERGLRPSSPEVLVRIANALEESVYDLCVAERYRTRRARLLRAFSS